MEKIKIYVGCSLTHASEEFKEGIENLKNELRKKYIVFDFLGLEKGTARDAFEYDIECVRKCDLFIAECSYPSTGLGYEIGFAVSLDKQVLAVAQNDAKVTRLILGVRNSKFAFRRYVKISEVVDMVKEKLEIYE
ncbi:MAG TPA: nucleoside 2-deoxyribosyltransferase [Candidatus Limnocylindrales bacterium]|nr:nucleoside 2-deoxyribosyltransferase [Candidatus Limnocylindrales bacterium]